MHIKLRQKNGGRLEVLDHKGQPIKGVHNVHLVCKDGILAAVITVIAPEVVIDAAAEVKTLPAEPIIPQPQPVRRDRNA